MRKESQDTLIKKFQIVQDTREQHPFTYPNTIVEQLEFGDYTIKYGDKYYLTQICVERKGAVSEIYNACGSGRERWERELEKMREVPIKMVLCEWDYLALVNQQPPGVLQASSVYGSICAWQVRFGIPFIFCGNRANARAYLYKTFYEYVKYKILELK